jgi:hypothetical protein
MICDKHNEVMSYSWNPIIPHILNWRCSKGCTETRPYTIDLAGSFMGPAQSDHFFPEDEDHCSICEARK